MNLMESPVPVESANVPLPGGRLLRMGWLRPRFWRHERRRGESIILSFANAHQLPTIYAIAVSHFGRRCANLDTITRVFERNPQCILVIGRPDADPLDGILGYCAMLWLSADGVARLLDGTLDPISPDLECIVPQGVPPSAAYIWALVATGTAGGALHRVLDMAQSAPFAALDFYTRPSTPSGLRIARTLGFTPISPIRDGSQRIFAHRHSDNASCAPAAT